MRTLLGRVLAALASAVLFLPPGVAHAQNPYLYPVGATDGAYSSYASYYDQSPAQDSSNNSELTSSNTAWAPAADCETCCDLCCDDVGTWRDNTLFSFGGEAYKSLGDTSPPPGPGAGFMDSAGLVGTFNTGFSIGLERVRGQIGGSYGIYDFKGRDTVSTSSAEQQTFITMGLYKRSDVCSDDRVAWGLVYDQFWAHQWGLFASELYVGQVRGLIGYATSEWNEFGVWGTFHTTTDNSVSGIAPPPVRAMNQYNVYWRHNYQFGGQSMLYVGGTDPADVGSWIFGFTGQAPLSHTLSLYGNFAYVFPSSATGPVGSNEEEWYFAAGLVYSWGAKAVSRTVSGPKGLPLLPVANNGQMFITN